MPTAPDKSQTQKVHPAIVRPWEGWIRSKADEYAVDAGCIFDLAAGEKVREFFRRFLRHSKGKWAGQAFELQDWQWEDIIAPLFGWKRANGFRRYQRAYIEEPKKNGKSTLASGVGLYLLVGDEEQGAEVFSAGADRDQASIVHNEAVNMTEASASLSKYLKINHTTHNISMPSTRSFYRALSSEADTKEGLNANGIIADELHAWYGRKLWDTLKYAGAARAQPLTFAITTAGSDPQSICREQHDYARGVIDGKTKDHRFFGYIRAAAPDDDWKDPAVWKKANPGLGVTIDIEDFAADVAEAEKTPTAQASFKRYRLNIWSTATNAWLKQSQWDACTSEFTAESLAGRDCFGGLDLSKTFDMTAWGLVFPDGPDDYFILPYFWLPEESVKNPKMPEMYRVWAEQGLLKLTPGSVVDYDFIIRDVAEMAERFNIIEFAYDPWQAEKTSQILETAHGIKRFSFAQTIGNFNEPTKMMERLIVGKRFHHNGNAILSWQAGNVNVRSDVNGNVRPVKPPDGDNRKIDGMVAGIMGLSRAMLSPRKTSVYEDRGVITV